MWRRHGAGLLVFTGLSTFTFVLVVAGLAVLFISFIQPSERHEVRVLLLVTLSTGATAFLLLSFQFVYHLVSSPRKGTDDALRTRLDAWLAYAADEGPLPPSDALSATALTRLREITAGESSEHFARLYEQHGFLVRDLRAVAGNRAHPRAQAIARLAKIRHRDSIPALRSLLKRKCGRRLAVEVLHSLARILDSESVSLHEARHEFMKCSEEYSFTPGEIEGALVLTGRHSAGLVRHILVTNRHPLSALEVVGHKHLTQLVPLLSPYLLAEDPEIRAGALRAVASLQLAPTDAEPAILSGLEAGESFVRAQAAKACVAIRLEVAEAPLIRALADDDWWVRRNAAQSIAAFGTPGIAILDREVSSHPDRFARDAARWYRA